MNTDTALNMAGALASVDIAVVIIAVALLFIIAWVKGKKEENTDDFFLGRRKIPAFIACLSFVATEVSAVTIIGAPAASYNENWHYLQFFIGSAAARIFVAFLFLPVFYKHSCTSIYEFLRHRFNPQTQYAGSIFFFITRLIASGVRLYAACLAVSLILGISLAQTIILFCVISIVFIAVGGIKAVVWSGAYQAIVFYLAGLAIITYIGYKLQGDFAQAWALAGDLGRLSVFNFDFSLNDPTTFIAATANAFFIGLAVFGTDQELVQRLLTVDTRKSSQKAIISTIFASLPLLCIYMAAGTMLFLFYKSGNLTPPVQPKEIVSHFTVNYLPAGLKGLILAAVILASIDSPLASLSSCFVMDIYKPLINPIASNRHYLFVSRAGVVGFGVILGLIAFACQPIKSVLWFAFEVISITGGATLGIFLFGVLFTRVSKMGKIIAWVLIACVCAVAAVNDNSIGMYLGKFAAILGLSAVLITFINIPLCSNPLYANTAAMGLSSFSMAALLIASKLGHASVAWSWLIVLGTVLTCSLACIFASAPYSPERSESALETQAVLG